jgi:peptidoglycan/LPS O-acetylase OafA/YrhL
MRQFNGIELCRLLCSVSVIIWHYQQFFVSGDFDLAAVSRMRPDFPLYHFLKPFYCDGNYAVEVFWAISGFIFFWKYAGLIHARGVSAREFFILRVSRLYPLHFATLLIVLVLQIFYRSTHPSGFVYQHNDIRHFALQLFFASNWLAREPYSFNGPIWSVSIEVLAYSIFFLLLRFCAPGLLLCGGVVVLIDIWLHFHYDLILDCLGFFFAGGFAERCIHQLDDRRKSIAFWAAGAAAACIILALHLGLPFNKTIQLFLSVAIIFWFALLDRTLHIRLLSLSLIGNMTYSSYLLQFPIQLLMVLIVDSLGLKRTIFLAPAALLLFVLMIFFSAFLSFKYFEAPIQILLRFRFLSKKITAASISPAAQNLSASTLPCRALSSSAD